MKIPQPNPSKNPAESQTITSAIYIRVSATKHAEKQLSKLRGFAQRQGWLVLEYLEEASTEMVARRPVLAQLLEDAKRQIPGGDLLEDGPRWEWQDVSWWSRGLGGLF